MEEHRDNITNRMASLEQKQRNAEHQTNNKEHKSATQYATNNRQPIMKQKVINSVCIINTEAHNGFNRTTENRIRLLDGDETRKQEK